MPYARPTLAELIERTQADLESRLPGTDPRLRRSLVGVLARVLAGAAHQILGHVDWVSRQVFPDTAEAEELGRWASVWGVERRPAAAASGTLTVTGTSGAVVPAGTVWQRSDGARFASAADATLAAGTAAVEVEAEEPGEAGTTSSGSTLTLAAPLSGVQSAATAAAGLSGGVDEEADESLRARLLARIRQPPHGGASFDYVAWALQVPGVTRAWCSPEHLGEGTVGVFFVCDGQSPIAPTPEQVGEVQSWIDARRPVTADVTVFGPTLVPLDLTLSVSPDTAAVRAAVEAELADLLVREAAPGATILLSHLREAISVAAGEQNHTLTSPAADVTHLAGEMATLGTLTWA